jgi:hypothetical protein
LQFIPSHDTLPPVGPTHCAQLGPHALVSLAAHRPLGHMRVPWLHGAVHMLSTHWGVACGSWVVHALPHVLQFIALLVVSTHVPEPAHSVSVPMHPDVHEYPPSEPEQYGVGVPHVTPHPPQLLAVSMGVSQP